MTAKKQRTLEEHLADTRTIDEKIADPSVNIGFLALDIEKEADLGVTIEDYQALNAIIEKARQRIKTKEGYRIKDGLEILKSIGEILTESGFRSTMHISTLNNSLKTKEIDCDEYAFIYLAIAESLKLPLGGIIVPEHILRDC